MTIQILDESIANKISAGEVIERPASVVKELVENSIDAGGTHIVIEIEDAGKKLISVTDDGIGMSAEDAVLSLQRHATSKISTADDLFSIRTLGFRGEAMPSISSISNMQITTRLRDADLGVNMVINAGKIEEMEDVSCPAGTRIEVRKLFFNTPARLKFLKSDQTELGQITDLINALSLCHNKIDFRLIINGRESLSRPVAEMEGRVSSWLGREVAESMSKVKLEIPGIKIEGFAGKPEHSRPNRSGQLFFVNGRRIINRTLTHAFEMPFDGHLEPKRFPVGVIRIYMDPELVDVNVHPAKAEVRFHRDGEMHSAVHKAVKNAMVDVNMAKNLSTWQPSPDSFRRNTENELPPTITTTNELPHLNVAPSNVRQVPTTESHHTPSAPSNITGIRAVGQLHNAYLLAEGRDGLLIINQHRAHERIIFDKMLANYSNVDSQLLLMPQNIHFDHTELSIILEKLESFLSCGYDLQPLSGQSIMVRAVPAILSTRDAENTLREIIADLCGNTHIASYAEDNNVEKSILEARRKFIAIIACHGALKAGKFLTLAEQQNLIDGLQESSSPTICPHGDPIMMTISSYELNRRFYR
jgi:DNA mismatch repair protein MutL